MVISEENGIDKPNLIFRSRLFAFHFALMSLEKA